MLREAAQVLVDPVVRVPGIWRTPQLVGEVGDHSPESCLEIIEGRRSDLQAFDNARGERHRRVDITDESHQGRPFAAHRVQAGQADGGDGEGMEVRN